jgi:hypothetical protein
MSGSFANLSFKYNTLQSQLFNLQLTTPQVDGDNVFTGTNEFTQIPTTATATAGDNSSKVATTEFVQTALSTIPDILSNDNIFTGTNQFTQIPTTSTATAGDNSSKVSTTEYVDTAISVIPDLLSTDNTFTGTNEFTEQVSFTLPPHSAPPLLGNDLATKGYVDSLVGQYSGGLNLFLNYSQPVTVGGINYFSLSKQVSSASQQSIVTPTNGGEHLLVSFISNELNILEIPAGLFDLFLYGAVSSPNQIVYYHFHLKKYSAGVITSISVSGNSKDINATPSNNPEVYLMNTTISTVVPMLLTDRIIIEIYYNKTAGTSVDLTTYFESAYYSFVQSTLNAGTTLLTSDNNWTGNNNFELSPTVPTVSAGDASTKVASTEFVNTAITTLLTLDNDFTGTNNFELSPTVPTVSAGDASTKVASTDFVTTAISNITPAVNYIDASGNASGTIFMTDNYINFENMDGTRNNISATTQSINGVNGDDVTSAISSIDGTNRYGTKMRADPVTSSGGLYTNYINLEPYSITELSVSIDGSTPTIGAIIGATSVPITIKSNLDMDQNTLTNIPSISSSSTLSITSTGAMTIGVQEKITSLVGIVKIPNDLIVGDPLDNEEVMIYGGQGGSTFTTLTQNDIQLNLGTRQRNALYVAFILPTTTGPSIMTLPSAKNSYSVKVVNNSQYPWTIRGQIGEAIIQGQGGFGTLNPNSVTINPFQTITFLQVNNISGQVNILDSQLITGTTSNFTALQCAFYDTGNSAISINVGTTSSGATNLGRLTQATDIRGQLKMNGSSGAYGQVITSRGETASPVWDAPYVTFNGSVRGDVFFPDRIISMSSLGTADNLINGSSLNITGYTGRLIESKVSSFVGTRSFPGNNYFTKTQAASSKGGVVTSFFDSAASSTTDFKFEIDGITPTIEAIIGAIAVPITIKSPLNMDGNPITNLLSLDSSSINITNNLIVGSGASTVRLFGGDGGDTFDTTTQNDIQLRLAGGSRNQIYNAVILNTTTGVGTIILPSILNGYYVYIINNSASDWTIKPQVGEFMRQGLAGGGVGNPSAGIIVRAFQTFGFFQLDSGTEKYSLIVSEVINGTSPTFSTILCNAYEGKSNTTVNFATFFASAVNISKANINTSINGRIRLGTNAGVAGQVITSAGASVDTTWSTPYVSPAGLVVPTTTLNMNQNSITNAPSIDSSTALTLAGTTALGINVGRAGQTTDVKGNLQVNGSAGSAGQVLTSGGVGLPPIWAAGGGGGSVSTYSFRKPTTVQSIPHNSSTTVFFDTVTVNTTSLGYSAGIFTNTSGTTLNVMVSYNIGFSPNASGIRKIALNSSILGNMSGCELAATTSVPMILTATSLVQLAHNATFIITAFQNSGLANNLTTPTNIQIIVL